MCDQVVVRATFYLFIQHLFITQVQLLCYILNSCLQDSALYIFVYNVWLLFDYYCMFNQCTVLFLVATILFILI